MSIYYVYVCVCTRACARICVVHMYECVCVCMSVWYTGLKARGQPHCHSSSTVYLVGLFGFFVCLFSEFFGFVFLVFVCSLR